MTELSNKSDINDFMRQAEAAFFKEALVLVEEKLQDLVRKTYVDAGRLKGCVFDVEAASPKGENIGLYGFFVHNGDRGGWVTVRYETDEDQREKTLFFGPDNSKKLTPETLAKCIVDIVRE